MKTITGVLFPFTASFTRNQCVFIAVISYRQAIQTYQLYMSKGTSASSVVYISGVSNIVH